MMPFVFLVIRMANIPVSLSGVWKVRPADIAGGRWMGMPGWWSPRGSSARHILYRRYSSGGTPSYSMRASRHVTRVVLVCLKSWNCGIFYILSLKSSLGNSDITTGTRWYAIFISWKLDNFLQNHSHQNLCQYVLLDFQSSTIPHSAGDLFDYFIHAWV